MKVIRQVCYEGSEEALRKQLAQSMPEGKREGWQGAVSIEVRTVFSELPELPPFVPVEVEPSFLLSGEDAKEFIKSMLTGPEEDV